MSLLRSLSDGLRSLFRKERVEGELEEELRHASISRRNRRAAIYAGSPKTHDFVEVNQTKQEHCGRAPKLT